MLNNQKSNTSPFVSIIVPCYNVSNYINKGLKSIFDQTYSNWECIVVNDGSTDNTINEIEKWTLKDSRFKLISQENKGLSGARNTGLKNISGDCIYFFDPDDLLDKDCLENLIKLYQDNIDVVIGKNGEVYNQTTHVLKTLDHFTTTEKILSDKNFIKLSIEHPFSVVAWNKLYNANFIFSNNLTFKEGVVHEDELWFFQTMSHASKIIFNSKVTYYYNIGNQDSITKNYKLNNLNSYLTVIETIYNDYYVPEKNNDKKIIIGTYILNFQITVISGFYRFLRKNKKCDFKIEGNNLIKKHLRDYHINEYSSVNNEKIKQFNLFIKYARAYPHIAFRLIRNSTKKNILKPIESLYLKIRYTP